jgi:hypothetical protein
MISRLESIMHLESMTGRWGWGEGYYCFTLFDGFQGSGGGWDGERDFYIEKRREKR